MRLIVRGGSIPAGIGVTISYVDLIQSSFPHIEIINRSRVGDSSFQGIWTFYDDIDAFRPEVMLIHFGIDDAYYPVYRSEFKENLVQIIRLARNRFDPGIMLLTSHPFENQYEGDMIYGYYRIIQEVARDLDCDSIPIHACWAGIIAETGLTYSHYVQKDYRYPNESGHEIYAQAVVRKLNTKLR